jgi:hypothetical protein
MSDDEDNAMHVRDLRAALQEIEEVFAAAGAKPAQKDLASLLELLNDNDDLDLSAFLESLRRNLLEKPGAAEWVRRLNETELNEASFLQIFSELTASPGTKAEFQAVAEAYTGSKLKAKQSKNDFLEAIKSEFYGRLYERDADKIAERATPW